PSSSIKIGQVLKVPGGSCGSGSSGSVNSAVASSSNLAWPTPCCASWYSPFGVPRSGGRTHKGLDIGHPSGTPVFAPANGVIAKAVTRDVGLCGLRAHIRLDSGQFILNCHMNSVDVRAGQRVSKCQKLGTVGKTGNARSTPPHDHFEIRVGGVAKNPLPILKRADEYCA
ncbi:MAG: M23 family metallopeptidase, partial [Candidatus Micrarchaeia archaeon]